LSLNVCNIGLQCNLRFWAQQFTRYSSDAGELW